MTELRSPGELPAHNWLTPDWSVKSLAGVVTTTRHGNFSSGVYAGFNLALHVGDDATCVNDNRRRLLEHFEPEGLRQIQWLEQVHGIEVLAASSRSCRRVPKADAAWTAEAGLGLAVMTADCLPVVLVARDGSRIGVAHGGWRGLVDGVLASLLAALGPLAVGYAAWIGPGIGVSAYEVGEEVATRVSACGGEAMLQPGRAADKFQLDLAGLARLQLQSLGVDEVVLSGVCSVTSPDCYSYRREGVTGRMVTLAWLR
jgi:polyphenol oxidase